MDAAPAQNDALAANAEGETGTTQQRARNPLPQFLFISFMLFLLTNHNGDEFLARHRYQDALRTLGYQLGNYTAWMKGNTTQLEGSNFTVPEQDASVPPLLAAFQIGVGGAVDPATSSYYANTTGTFHGDATFHNITPPALHLDNTTHESWSSLAETYMAEGDTDNNNMTVVLDKLGTWDWAASNKVALSLVEKPPVFVNASRGVALVHGKVELTDERTSEELRLEFEGIHFVPNGTIYALVEPTGQHVDLRFLPSIVPEASRNETAQIVEPELASRIAKLKSLIDAGIIEQEATDEVSKTTCPFTLYVALDRLSIPERFMREYEEEVQSPAGIWTVKPPPMAISGVLVSKECGVLYEFHKAEGVGLRSLFRKLTTYAGSAAITYLILLILLFRQMARSRTPSGISRLSYWTFLVQATVDSLSFAGHTVFALVADGKPSLSLIVPAFLACVLFANEAGQFTMLIQQFQAPEDAPARAAPTAPAPPATATTNGTPTGAVDTPSPRTPTPSAPPPPSTPQATAELPAPAAQQPQPPQIPRQPSFLAFLIQHLRSDPQMRLWLVMFVFLTLMVHTILSATLSIIFVSITYSFFWLPQIARSARRGRGSGLSAEYLVGTTVCRLYIALYFLLCPKNVLDIEPRRWAYFLAGFVCLQMSVVILQDTNIGPTFFLPRRYAATKGYDYHPVMPTSTDPESPDQSLGDCAICMDAIYADPAARRRSLDEKGKSEWGASGTSKRKTRTKSGGGGGGLAPCHHLFHTECLERWLAIKNICPQCRRPLPPL
ncbi:RING-type domain-containing protein [Mycena sanguinolenta]|uniref:RING-type E3 ubiquitin transferase n=1 Tax=Mycena sanguinolenta TaxID=230812 RepID=A0A8H6Z0Y6_9AGAR|nr:RING-type domain-containing protein [Mycena sanguinolenta]